MTYLKIIFNLVHWHEHANPSPHTLQTRATQTVINCVFFFFVCRVKDEIYKLVSINLSPNVTGQLAMGMMCNPPRPGSESYALHMKEKDALLQSLMRRAKLIVDAFNR